jgi:glycogen synthase
LAGRDLFGYVANRTLPAIEQAGVADRFHVVGGIGLHEVRGLLSRCDIFMLPSLWENCPYSCIEAMTARRAIVASDCGGVPELIGDRQNGLLAKTGDAKAFVAACQELIESRELRQRLGEAARKTVEERLTDVAVAARITDLYRKTVAPAHRLTSAPSDALSVGADDHQRSSP